MSILIKPIITEKATNASERFSRYTFVVKKDANKIQIKDAVEATYGVTVESVRTLNHPALRKTKYTKKGLVSGLTSGYKKAVVKLAEGEIDFYNNL
ncbi:50S ribosomal protein L23 [Tenacibaculum sp. IB213877]|uniref:50S ribosomal protein L23 n=1 Tax=Tenacibaculum sp. IB213877 TaxID=3097351 RepID=UPI002A5AD8A9|nr:50S ribosomal protein L23 [Tenacibaculum sp. IB213877]MDY0780072.1 50S ribosomal protein L23 [Tenacibaculum sp. IB213877]